MATIRASEVLPVDLNSLMYKLESILAHSADLANEPERHTFFQQRAEQRKEQIQTRFYDDNRGFFTDLLLDLQPVATLSIAGVFPLFVSIAREPQAEKVAARLLDEFLKVGGWVTTPVHLGQQWDAPNGWAPMQWVAYAGLCNYAYDADAVEGAQRWVNNNLHVYHETGKLIEKYNVEDVGLLAGGGEYAVQDGFGWTNGVLLKFLDILEI
jgi:alpha,alpha-trehalase